MGRALEEIATVRDFSMFLSYPKVVKVASYIDVIWFTGDTDALVPEFAFEVEHTTEVTKGLGRLFDLYKAGLRTKLFIVLPDKKLDKFHTEIERSLFGEIKEIIKVKTYEPLINLYMMALEHDSQKKRFFEG